MPKSLAPEVAEKYELTGLKEAGDIYHPSLGEVSLSDLNLAQANQLVLDKCPYLKPVQVKK